MSEPTDRELQDLESRLAQFRSITAPASLRRDLRGALLAAPYVPAPSRDHAWTARLRPVLAVIVVFAILAGGAGSAAAGSLPGDAAFGLKRAVEDVQVAFAPDDTARLDLLVAQSGRRLDELETLASRNSNAVGVATDEYTLALARLEQMLATVSSEDETSARDAAIDRAEAAVAAHIVRLQALAKKLPDAAQQGIERAIEAGKGNGVGPDKSPRPSKSNEPGKPSDAPGGGPDSPGGRSNDNPRPTPPTPSHR